jgi:hypothetical protein
MQDKPIRLTLGVIALVATANVAANDFRLDWWSSDGGGDMWTTGDDFELSGTIGQPDAGAIMTGGDFELAGGFWPGAVGAEAPIPGDCNGDRVVDLHDFGDFSECLLGPRGGLGSDCDCFDLDQDGDVTLRDFASFAVYFTVN